MEKKIQKRLLQLVAGTLAVTLIASVLFLYTVVQSVLIRNYDENNQRFADQISTTFETVIDQITDQCYKLLVYNTELTESLEAMQHSIVAAIGLYDALDSIVMSNSYLYSAYLYLPSAAGLKGGGDGPRIYATDWGCSFTEERFYDQEILPYFSSDIIQRTPVRTVRTIQSSYAAAGDRLLFSIIVPLADRCVFVANVDLQRLYDEMLQKNVQDETLALYITDADGRIFAPFPSAMFGKLIGEAFDDSREITDNSLWLDFLMGRPISAQSSSTIESLGWTFHLISEMQFDVEEFFDQIAVVIVIVLLFLFLLILSHIVIWKLTSPLQDAIFAYNEKVFRDILLNADLDEESVQKQLGKMGYGISGNTFSLALVEHSGSQGNLSAEIQQYNAELKDRVQGMDVRIVDIRPSLTVLLFHYNKEEARLFTGQRDAYLRQLYQHFGKQYPGQIWIVLSRQGDSLRSVSTLFHESVQMLNYKLVSEGNFIQCSGRRLVSGDPAPYPANCEKQILNNMMISNAEGCYLYARKFLDTVLSRENFLPDTLIENYLYQLQNAVLKEITSLPISINLYREDSQHFQRAADVEEWLMGFLRAILEEIGKKNARDENVLEDSIFQYIRENLCENDFNLNAMSYQFNMNRNYLTRLIKEKTGMSFNDYVNHQRIQLAKELLQDHSLTVEAISHRVGFAYAHYFIKTFKGVEGITPGQYRKMMDDNKNAQE